MIPSAGAIPQRTSSVNAGITLLLHSRPAGGAPLQATGKSSPLRRTRGRRGARHAAGPGHLVVDTEPVDDGEPGESPDEQAARDADHRPNRREGSACHRTDRRSSRWPETQRPGRAQARPGGVAPISERVRDTASPITAKNPPSAGATASMRSRLRNWPGTPGGCRSRSRGPVSAVQLRPQSDAVRYVNTASVAVGHTQVLERRGRKPCAIRRGVGRRSAGTNAVPTIRSSCTAPARSRNSTTSPTSSAV